MSNLLEKRLSERSTTRSGVTSIGAISLFALIVILCIAVLAVLTIASAHSSLVMSQRQASSVQEIYANESAAQAFVAEIDRIAHESGGADAVESQLDTLCQNAKEAAGGSVEATAHMDGQRVFAEFQSPGGRTLKVALTLEDGTYRIDSWRTAVIENQEPPMGSLYLGD